MHRDMNHRSTSHRILSLSAAVYLSAAVLGCAENRDPRLVGDDRPSTNPTFIPGYFELTRHGTIYVMGSTESFENVRQGNLPPRTIRRFSSRGVPVIIEANDSGLEYRLLNEFEKRHGLSSK